MNDGALWGGRFDGTLAPDMRALTTSTHFDMRLAADDCRVLAAHVSMLAAAGVMRREDAETVKAALGEIAAASPQPQAGDEDVHSVVERELLARAGGAGASARAGLSRNDRVVTAFRLWAMRNASAVRVQVLGLAETLAARAEEHAATVMPGYTHLQRAQPVTLGLALCAHAAALVRDAARIAGAAARASESPLGAGALAASTFGLDRELAAKELGFGAVAANTIDAVASRDFALEMLAAFAIAGVTLSRLGEDLVLWTSTEFGFATLDDAYATGSSLMPQKKNADVAELARGKAGRLAGDFTALLVACKGLPLAYNRDLQEDKEPLFDAVDTLLLVLPALTGAMRTIRFDAGAMQRAAADPFLLATDRAEALTKATGFRDAHAQVGRAVREALESGAPFESDTDAATSARLRTERSLQASLAEIRAALATG